MVAIASHGSTIVSQLLFQTAASIGMVCGLEHADHATR